jgi:hypothetical protein
VTKDNALYVMFRGSDGSKKQLPAGGVIAIINYPAGDFSPTFESDADAAVNRITDLINRYSLVRPQLENALHKWERAQSVYAQTRAKPDVKAALISPIPELVIGSDTYKNVRLVGVNGEKISVSHAAGVANIDASALSAGEIRRLNQTSDSVQVGTERQKARAITGPTAAELSPAAIYIEKISDVAISSIGDRFGVNHQTLRVWLLDFLMPLLVLILTVTLVIQSLKARNAPTVLPKRSPPSIS